MVIENNPRKPIYNKKRAYLFGSPVAHSISPKMHNLSFDELKINATYKAIDIERLHIDAVDEYIRREDFLGANVTMPLKTDIISHIDRLDISSELSGSVNTIVQKDGSLVGYTTDGAGFIDSLREIDENITDKKILILGAGGAAKSIIVSLALEGTNRITIAKRYNKTIDSVIEFAEKVSDKTPCDVNVIDIEDSTVLKEAVTENDILINATPVGMTEDSTLIDKSLLRPNLTVCDLIYEPPMTKLLKDSKECGCKYINGKYMLLYQGARSFKLWTGQDMPVKKVKGTIFS